MRFLRYASRQIRRQTDRQTRWSQYLTRLPGRSNDRVLDQTASEQRLRPLQCRDDECGYYSPSYSALRRHGTALANCWWSSTVGFSRSSHLLRAASCTTTTSSTYLSRPAPSRTGAHPAPVNSRPPAGRQAGRVRVKRGRPTERRRRWENSDRCHDWCYHHQRRSTLVIAAPPPIATTCDLCVCVYIKCEVYSCVASRCRDLSCPVAVAARATEAPQSNVKSDRIHPLDRHGRVCLWPAEAAACVASNNMFFRDLRGAWYENASVSWPTVDFQPVGLKVCACVFHRSTFVYSTSPRCV